jgi:2-polyprenyl-6-methoxyphenol hydroxylase-like FAD-dependent oxidoreductase
MGSLRACPSARKVAARRAKRFRVSRNRGRHLARGGPQYRRNPALSPEPMPRCHRCSWTIGGMVAADPASRQSGRRSFRDFVPRRTRPNRALARWLVVQNWVYAVCREHPRTPGYTKGGRYLGRRSAFPQWCENPTEGPRIAVGDAAFAYDPLAGQGIRFALASAFAAASVIQCWKENGDRGTANCFYGDFVRQARARHLEFLAKLELDLPADVLESLAEQRSLLRKHRLRRVKHRQPHRHRSRDYTR